MKLGQLPRFSTIGFSEKRNLSHAMRRPLSGYIGGRPQGGYWVQRLADEWCSTFQCKYAIPCNSATSGLLAACLAAGIGPGSVVWTTAYSMSATAACAKVLGAHIVFIDIETIRFSMNMNNFKGSPPKAIIVTNLFGHPAYLGSMRSWCDSNKVVMIEDNAQSPFAMENGKYAGTIGHMGVFSLNVHKHIQCGEGGVVTTSDPGRADLIAGAINHGELAGYPAGLNLRMTEPIAAIACAQLSKAPKIIDSRISLALEITDMFSGVPWIKTPVEDVGCKHVYYMWAALIKSEVLPRRIQLIMNLQNSGFPIRSGYAPTLNRVFRQNDKCPMAEAMEDFQIITFEICAYDPKTSHLKKMREIVKRAVDDIAA